MSSSDEAVSRFDPEAKKVVKQVLDSNDLAARGPPLVVVFFLSGHSW